MKIEIALNGDRKAFISDIHAPDKLVIGRFDPDTGVAPAIDLGPHKALEHGVSRNHAALSYRHNMVQITDLGSHNGTYVNELQVFPSQPRRLKDGDMIRVGFLTLTIQMTHSPQTESLT